MTLSILAGKGKLIARALNRGIKTVSYWHKKTDTTIEVEGYFISQAQVKDPIGGRTEFQDVPRWRLVDLPYGEKEVIGDKITDENGKVWTVRKMTMKSSGLATIYPTTN